uniref:XK-related protein n=1 Tax=Amphimedon queenslandica TaxID=400682 RepID=A0A1X7VGH4_AMPQE
MMIWVMWVKTLHLKLKEKKQDLIWRPGKMRESPAPLLDEEERGKGGLRTEAHPASSLEEDDSYKPLDKFSHSQFAFIVILHLLQVGFLFRVLRLLYLNCRRRDKLSFDRYKDISFLRLMEGFFESAPQLLLQLYVVTLEEIPDIERKVITGMAVVISMGSLALAIGDYISAEKDIDHYNPHGKKMTRLSWGAYFLIIVAHLFLIVSRGIAISLFATEFYLNVFIIGAAHYLLMVYWMFKQNKVQIVGSNNYNDSQTVNGRTTCCGRYCFELLAAIFNVFFPFRLQKDSFSFIVSYYIVFFFENLILILLWVISVDYTQNLWYLEAAPITVVLGFLLGIALLLCYHFKCEPKVEESTDTDEESPDFCYSVSLDESIMVTSTLNRLYFVTNRSIKND